MLYQNTITYIMFLMILAFTVLLIVNFRYILKSFKKIHLHTWYVLCFIISIGAVLSLLLPNMHLLYIDESWHMEAAKNMIQKGEPVVCTYDGQENCTVYVKSIGVSSIVAIAFAIFGISNWVALYLSSLFGILTIPLMFLMAYLLFNREKIALVSAVLLALTPLHLLWSQTIEQHVIPNFFMLLTFTLFLTYFKIKKNNLLTLSALSLAITLQMRGEFILLLPIIMILYYLNCKKTPTLASILIVSIGVIMAVPQLLFLKGLQEDIYPGAYFGLKLLLENAVHAIRVSTFLFNPVFIGFLVYAIWKWKGHKGAIFLGSWFLIFLLFYMSFIRLQDRMLLTPMLALIMIVSFGLSRLKWHYLIPISVLFITLPGLYSVYTDDYSRYILETRLPEEFENVFEGCIIIAENPTIIHANTDIESISTEYALQNEITNECLLYFKDGYCVRPAISSPIFGPQKGYERCRMMHQKYSLEEIANFREKDVIYTLYEVK